jgi:hypothetical protein
MTHHVLTAIKLFAIDMIPIGLVILDAYLTRPASHSGTAPMQPAPAKTLVDLSETETFQSKVPGLPVWSMSRNRFV